MKKILAVVIAAALFVIGISALAAAGPYDPGTGTVTVMANGGTVYVDTAAGPISVGSDTLVASLTLPSGRYELLAKAWIDRSVGSESFVQCGFVNSVADNDNSRAGASADSATMVAAGVVDFEEESDVEYRCATDDTVDAYRVVLMATTVSAIHEQ